MSPRDAEILSHTRCRICKGALEQILTLGSQYLVDFPNAAGTKRHAPVPLDLCRCQSPTCGLVQLAHTTPAAWMYQHHYWYRSGVNESMVAELHDVVEGALKFVDLPPHAIVVDIGANDGTLLQQYDTLTHARKLTKVAFEPARNLFEVLRPHTTVLMPEFFKVERPWNADAKARVVTSIAMFYDLEDPHEFVHDVGKILHQDGIWVIQQSYLPLMLAAGDYTNICHEHVEYYHLQPLEALLDAHDMEVVAVEARAINGGSFRTYVQWKGAREVQPSVAAYREEERLLFDTPGLYQNFADRVAQVQRQLKAVVQSCVVQGATIDLYGASTKSQVMLQACGLDGRVIRQAWERSPEKWGRYVGTSGIPMVSEVDARKEPPQVLLMGIWQHKEAALARERGYLESGGQVLLPLPEVEIVELGRV